MPPLVPEPPPEIPAGGLNGLLRYAVARGASDLHLKVPSRPVVRVNGTLEQVPDWPALEPAATAAFAEQLLQGKPAAASELADEGETDLSHAQENVGRFRVNIFKQRGSVSLVLRVVPFGVPVLEDLNLPASVA